MTPPMEVTSEQFTKKVMAYFNKSKGRVYVNALGRYLDTIHEKGGDWFWNNDDYKGAMGSLFDAGWEYFGEDFDHSKQYWMRSSATTVTDDQLINEMKRRNLRV